MTSQQELQYICTPQIVQDDDGRLRKAYRFNVLNPADGRVLCAVNDVCGSAGQARELEGLFRRNQVSLKHVMDVLEDWIAYRR